MRLIHFSIISLFLAGLVFASCKKNYDTHPIVVDAGSNQTIQLPVDTATLTAIIESGSTANTTYLWTLVSGPGVPVFSNNNSLSTAIGNLVAGTYIFQFEATNNYGMTGIDTVSIVVNPNIMVDAGLSQYVHLPSDTTTLTGTVKSGQTSNMAYLWTVLSGPSVPGIVSSNLSSTKINNLVAGTYVFQFKATNNLGLSATDTTSVIVTAKTIVTNTIIIQPGIITGQDAEAIYIPGYQDGNGAFGNDTYLRISDWTYSAHNAGEGVMRSFIKFTALDTLPAGAIITSAKLSLFASTTLNPSLSYGNSYYPGSPYNAYGDNKLWLQKLSSNWDQTTLTYLNQPATTTTDEVEVPASTSQWDYSVAGLDITKLIQDMKATAGTNFGFCMKLQTEAIYRQVEFDASESKPDSSTGPKLVVTYQY